MHGLHQPHSTRPQGQFHTAVLTGSGGKFLRWVLPVHRNHERARQGAALVGQADGKILTSAEGIGIFFGDEGPWEGASIGGLSEANKLTRAEGSGIIDAEHLERKAEYAIALRAARRRRKHEALGTARK